MATEKKAVAKSDFVVLKDTREQAGWTFKPGKGCLGMQSATLKTGDYTLLGYESVFTIERKGTTAEFAGNVFDARFTRELERLALFRYAFVVLEFDLSDLYAFPANSGIPKSRWRRLRVNGTLLVKRLNDYLVQYPTIHFVLVGGNGREFATSLFRRVIEIC